MPTRHEVSAGGVVYRPVGDGFEIALAARRTRRGELAWGLAKGAIEPGESDEEAALREVLEETGLEAGLREVLEETGLEAEIEADLGEIRYFYVWDGVRVRKRVHFFLMRATGGDVSRHDAEMEEVRWLPLAAAIKRAAYRGERDVVKRAAGLLA